MILEEDIIRDSSSARVPEKRNEELGDFTATLRVIPISGLVTLEDLLKARTRHVEEERHREQMIRFPYPDALKGFRPRYDS